MPSSKGCLHGRLMVFQWVRQMIVAARPLDPENRAGTDGPAIAKDVVAVAVAEQDTHRFSTWKKF